VWNAHHQYLQEHPLVLSLLVALKTSNYRSFIGNTDIPALKVCFETNEFCYRCGQVMDLLEIAHHVKRGGFFGNDEVIVVSFVI
jgi:hypothetical protein